MNCFPLSDALIPMPNDKYMFNSKTALVDYINNKLSQKEHELLFNVIRRFQLQNDKNCNKFDLPYKSYKSCESVSINASIVDNYDVKFNLLDLPVELRSMIKKFCTLHYHQQLTDAPKQNVCNAMENSTIQKSTSSTSSTSSTNTNSAKSTNHVQSKPNAINQNTMNPISFKQNSTMFSAAQKSNSKSHVSSRDIKREQSHLSSDKTETDKSLEMWANCPNIVLK